MSKTKKVSTKVDSIERAEQKAFPKPLKPMAKGFTYIPKVIKGDTYLVLADPQYQIEDEFAGNYFTLADATKIILQPPFDPKVLARMVTQNNVLSQCIDVMEVNIDGTGYDFVPVNEDTKQVDAGELKKLQSFFAEPYPNQSFIYIRRKLRRELESIGYGFLEVLRNKVGDIVGVRNMVGHAMRMVKLDKPVQVTKTIERDGADVELTMWDRERRFAQRLWGIKADNFVYYREFGTTRDINRDTGEWAKQGEVIPDDQKGTEVLAFGVIPDTDTPYSVPRWINQLPSVVGSRKAEESNLEYFDAGGLPPAIIFIEGGTLADDVADQLKTYMSGINKNRNRAMVVEAQSTSGALESAGQVKVTVERFGAEKANDAMFMGYDTAASNKIRGAFRFTELFLGSSASMNFATALTAYMVAEAQVFSPERTHFDEMINKTIIKGLGIKTGKIRSNTISLKNVEVQLQAMGLVEQFVDKKDFVDEINRIAGTDVEFDETAAALAQAGAFAAAGMGPDGKPLPAKQPGAGGDQQQTEGSDTPANDQGKQVGAGLPTVKPKAPVGMRVGSLAAVKAGLPLTSAQMFTLVQNYAQMYGLTTRKRMMSDAEKAHTQKLVSGMSHGDSQTFMQMLASQTLNNPALAEVVKGYEHV